MAKSRVAPLKAITIPRLELTAATVAAKIYQFLQDELNFDIHQVYFWTDSMIVLKYLQNTSTRFKRFVSNCIQMIQESTHVTDWNYVPSSLNPADLASRGIRSEETAKLNYWFQGPSFLQKNDNYQENFKMKESEAAIDENEIKHAFALEVMTDTESFIQYFSQYEKLLAAVSWLRKFVLFLKIKTTGKDMSTFQKQIRVSDLEEAEKQVIRYIQAREFEQEIKSLQENKPVLKSSVLSSLCPIYESELLRVGGRLQDSSSDVNKHAVILPSNYVTDMIVKHIHEKNGHTGINHCLSVVRRKFFLLKGYKTVKRVIGSCFQCKRSYKKPCEQKMANLPEERTAVGNPPFTVIGIDYFGPMLVKHGRGTAKRYGCLFTCLTTRAVHLEISHSLDSDSFLMAFHRFIARRGKPIKVWSDNGRNFVKAEKELKEVVQELNSKKVTDAMLIEAIEWIFLPPHAPHMGGIWERLVRSVKNVLRLLINQNLVTDEQLVTFMCEVEKIMNDRPLTTVSSDAKDDLPITPNHLLLMKRNDCNPMCYSNYVQRRWKLIHHIANRFYSRFVAEYLPLLQERPKWREIKDDVKVNDIVLVLDENLPRGQWPLGLVKEVKCGRDGLVRSVQVKVGDKIKTRPITKLVLLEHHDE